MFYLTSLIVLLTAIVVVVSIRAVYPTPLPGIPYLEASARTPFGDVRDLLKTQSETGELWKFLVQRCEKLQSPIFQVFCRPFEKPWVVVVDPKETHNILVRRVKELDRSDFFINFFKTHQPEFQMVMKTDDRWRANRRLVADTQSPGFLNELVRRQIYHAVLDLLSLLSLKLDLAGDQAFDAGDDVLRSLLESSWAVHFGARPGATRSQVEYLKVSTESNQAFTSEKHKVVFTRTKEPADLRSLKRFTESYETKLKLPLFQEAIFRLMFLLIPSLRRAKARVDALIDEYLDIALEKMTAQSPENRPVPTCSTELLVAKALETSEKTGEVAQHRAPAIQQELMGSLIGSAESTGFTMCWGLKFLSAYQNVQQKLREALHEAYPEFPKVPAAEEIFSTNVPYLDAVLEEILRCGNPMPVIPRTAAVDTQVLGYAIPKGTEVMMLVCGPGYQSPNREASGKGSDEISNTPLWEDHDIHVFKPERWLKVRDGKQYFDPRAGPMYAFGAGPRSCFGQRQARVQMRVFITLILSSFELKSIPEEITDWMAFDTSFRKPQRTFLRLARTAPS